MGKKTQKMEHKMNSVLWSSNQQSVCSKVRLWETPKGYTLDTAPREWREAQENQVMDGHNPQGLLELKLFVPAACSVGRRSSCVSTENKPNPRLT